ncbi:MAG TPA: (Fe-S)-binding protein [Polyangiaceae bacterium]|nr:(Fe-S)-binding protein [Polyangiaceae bacterium]
MKSPHRLNVLSNRQPELETCAYCPKLCRAACPIAEVEASETVTPWGQMRAVFDVARGAIEPSADFAALSWACSSCRNCRESCDQRNLVPETLFEARALYREQGLAPPSIARFHERFGERLLRVKARIEELRARHHSATAPTALVLGCEYALHLPGEIEDGIAAAQSLFGAVRIVSGCCGLPLDAAGDPVGARTLRAEMKSELGDARRKLAFDAGCAFTLRDQGVEPFARAAEAALAGVRTEPTTTGSLRYHDPCYLARGLGETRAPRALLERASGRPPAEFSRRENRTYCSGGGGLLPLSRPETRARIAANRLEEHERLGGGTIVTACAASLRSLRTAGASVVDLMTIVRQLSNR